MSHLGSVKSTGRDRYKSRASALVNTVKEMFRSGYSLQDLHETVMGKQVSIDCLRRILNQGSYPVYENLCKMERALKTFGVSKETTQIASKQALVAYNQVPATDVSSKREPRRLSIYAEPELFSLSKFHTILRVERRPIMLQGGENEILYVLPLWEPSWCESCEGSNGNLKGVAEMIIYEPKSAVFTYNHRSEKNGPTGYRKICMTCFQRIYHQKGLCDWMMR
jgi:hypothetical protein